MKTSYKLFLTLSLAFVSAFAYEQAVYNDDFLYEQSEIELKIYQEKKQQVESIEDSDNRDVASAERELPNITYVRYNDLNKEKIDGEWKVTRIINHKKRVILDVRNRAEDKDKELILDFKMMATSLVEATYREPNVVERFYFDVSRLSKGATTIALFRAYKNGFEIFEAERVVKYIAKKDLIAKRPMPIIRKPIINKPIVSNVVKKVVRAKRFIKIKDVGVPMDIERASYPSRAKGLLQNNKISGSISFGPDSIESLNVTLLPGTNNEIEIAIDPSDINKVGHFHFYEENNDGDLVKASGLVTANGEGGYRIRFVNGTHSGAMLSFVTDEELVKMEDAARERALNQEVQASDAKDDNLLQREPQSIKIPKGFSFSSKSDSN